MKTTFHHVELLRRKTRLFRIWRINSSSRQRNHHTVTPLFRTDQNELPELPSRPLPARHAATLECTPLNRGPEHVRAGCLSDLAVPNLLQSVPRYNACR